MKIAFTGDIHLTKKKNHPARWQTFKNLLKDIKKKKIDKLIIAGDLFNDDYQNYSHFDALTSEYKNITFFIIPGNHDSNISEKSIIGENVKVFTDPTIETFDESSFPFFFLPYKAETTMGSEIAIFNKSLKRNKWVLIGHGDWAGSIKIPNLVEPGIYMPLSKKDLEDYKPCLTLLGHIHKPISDKSLNIFYAGSPCGLNITETGKRRYLILNTETLEIDSTEVNSEVIYFDETVVVYPMENEEIYWESEIKTIKDKWNLTPDEKAKTVIRIKVKGYSSNKRKLKIYFDNEFEDFSFWNGKKVDVSEVSDSDNYELLKIIERVSERINELKLEETEREPTKKEILSKAIERIYGIK